CAVTGLESAPFVAQAATHIHFPSSRAIRPLVRFYLRSIIDSRELGEAAGLAPFIPAPHRRTDSSKFVPYRYSPSAAAAFSPNRPETRAK
ncbi:MULTISPECIES: hypothetical protein, partial [unclassified Burkholderia]|uniref:hypothetical protein n=1 Tax=unclassified Burkholderia TaxID=2613784 RepID=UPI002AB2AEFD